MSQCGWRIWQKPKRFPSLEEMIRWIATYCEAHPEKGGPDGTITMIGYDHCEEGVLLRSIADWQPNVLSQVAVSSQMFVSLAEMEEEIFS